MSDAMIPTLTEDGVPKGFAYKAGQRMPNGAIIIAETVIVSPDDPEHNMTPRISVVLALTLSDVSPYCTWQRVIRVEDDSMGTGFSAQCVRDFCETGHYHSDITVAAREYTQRVLRERELYGKVWPVG